MYFRVSWSYGLHYHLWLFNLKSNSKMKLNKLIPYGKINIYFGLHVICFKITFIYEFIFKFKNSAQKQKTIIV